jgi:putative acetyltransferase
MPDTNIREARTSDLGTVRDLVVEYARSLPFALDFQNFDEELALLPAPYLRPRGLQLLVEDKGEAIGVGAYRPLDDEVAEIKRMYVRPVARGRGVGSALLDMLIARASGDGYARVRLDSHRASMRSAIGLYRSRGFVEIDAYGPDLDGALVFFEKTL